MWIGIGLIVVGAAICIGSLIRSARSIREHSNQQIRSKFKDPKLNGDNPKK